MSSCRATNAKGPDYTGLEARVLTQQVDALEKRCALQLETIRELRAELESFKALCRKLNDVANATSDALEEELEVLFATHRREVAKLKLESDRRTRSVAEAMLARCKALVAICDANMDDTNIEALVDESKI